MVYTVSEVQALPRARRQGGVPDALYSPLWGTTAEGPFDPKSGLTESYTVNADSTVWTLKVRGDVLFHNGDKASSADFLFAIESATDPKLDPPWNNSQAVARTITSLTTPDPATMVAALTGPNIFWSYFFSRNRANQNMGNVVLASKYITSTGDDQAGRSPVGSGPYKFKSITIGDRLTYEAVDYKHFYFGAPRIKTLTALAVPEPATRVALLKTKAVDLTPISSAAVTDVTQSGFTIIKRPNAQWGLLYAANYPDSIPGYGPNPLMNKTVRQAIYWYAIDRKTIVDSFLKGNGTPSMDYPIAKADPLAYIPQPVPTYDPAKARAMLAEAGYGRGFELDLYIGPAGVLPEAPDIMEAIAVYWESVGVKVNRKRYLGVVFTQDLTNSYKTTWPKPTVQGLILSGGYAENSVSAIALQSNSAGLYHVNRDPETQRLALLVGGAKTLDEYKATAQAYQKYVHQEANHFPILFEADDVYATSEKVSKQWKLGRDAQNIRIEYAAAWPH